MALTAAAVGVVLASLYIGAREVDRVALSGQQKTIARAVNQYGLAHARELRLMTVWDDTYDNVTARNIEWMDKYLGGYLNEVLGYERVYVLSGDEKVIYGSINGEKGSADRPLPYSLAKLVHEVRASHTVLPTSHIATTPVTLGAGTVVNHRSVVDVLPINGKPTSVIVSTIVPDHGSDRSVDQNFPLLVATQILSDADIHRIGLNFGFSELHWTENGPRRGYDTEVIRDTDGDPVATLAWRRMQPGRDFLRDVAPGLLLALLPIAAITYLLLMWGSRQVKRLMESEAQAKRAARTDVLTELPNFVALRELLGERLGDVTRSSSTLAVLAIDIDHFKSINDAFGNAVGDTVLKAVAQRLKALAPEHGIVARPDSDNFVMLAPELDRMRAAELASDIVTSLTEPFDLGKGTRVFLTAAVGYAIAPSDGKADDELMRRAELALRKAKDDPELDVLGFTSDMDIEVTYRLMLERALRTAIAENAISVAYQPLMNPDGTLVVGVEALARWNDPELGTISPDVFIPLAEETGLIHELGEYVLRRATLDGLAWPDINVAVNVSASQIHHGDIVHVVSKVLEENGFPPERLEIEITESVLLADEKRANEQIRGLRKLDVQVALDDFGTGYSSLQYLRHFGFDKLKIDRSFIDGAGAPQDSSIVLASIIKLGHDLKLTITAEGVETAEQQAWLRASGCHQLQGYLFSRPLTKSQATQFIAAHSGAAATAS